MLQTLYIDLPGTSRETYRGVIASMAHYGFQVPQASARIVKGRTRVTALAQHCSGDVTGAARELVCALPQGASIEVDHANPFH